MRECPYGNSCCAGFLGACCILCKVFFFARSEKFLIKKKSICVKKKLFAEKRREEIGSEHQWVWMCCYFDKNMEEIQSL